MDDFEKYFQDRLKKDKKLAYIHNSLLDMGYIPGEFPSELIYKLGDEFENNQIENSSETINTSLILPDTLIQLLKDTPISSFVEFEKESKRAKKVKDNEWEVDNIKNVTTDELIKLIFNQRWVDLKENLDNKDWEIIHKVEEHFGTYDIPPKGKTFIMPDGKFLNMSRCNSHSNIEQWLIDNNLSKLRFAYLNDGSPTLSKLGCFRCNPVDSYCILPAIEYPPHETFNSLLLWLDYVKSIHPYVDIVGHDTKYKRYYFEKLSSDDIIDRVTNYYIHHELFENEVSITRHFNKNYIRGPVGSELLLEEIDPKLIKEANEKVRNILKEHNIMEIRKTLTEDVLRDRIKTQIERLEKNDLLVYDAAAGFGFNKLFVRINNLHPEYYTIWNENDDGEVANLTKYSSIENVIDWVIKDATSYTPKLYKNKYIKIEEEWSHGDSNINYIDTYVWKDDTQDNIEFNEFTAALKEFLQSNFTDYESLIELELVPWEEKRGYFKIIPIFGEVDLVGYTIPAYEILNKDVEKDYNLSEIEKEDIQDAREKLINDIEEINRKLPELQSWGFKKYKTGEKFNTDLINEGWSYKDKHGLEVVDLEYYDLPYEAYYGPMDWETGVGKNYVNTIIPSYVYTADKQDIEEFFANFLYEKDPEYTSIEDDEEGYEYISQNFDSLMDKYYDDVLEEFKEDAIEDAYSKYSPEDFEYYPD